MNNLSAAKDFLIQIGMPTQQQTDIAGYTLLTLANINPNQNFSDATNNWIRC